jgi:very-short-patch-repair endonuclease
VDGGSAGTPSSVTLPVVSRQPYRPDPLHGRVFRGSWAVRTGVLTRAQLRSSAWRRLREDVYADATEPDTHRLHARSAALVMPRGAAFGGRTAAVLHGLTDAAGPGDPVEVVPPPSLRWDPQPGVRVRTASLDGDMVGRGPFLRWTAPVRTAVDLARRGPVPEAVVLLDQLVDARVVELTAVRAAVSGLPRCRGSRTAREVVARADGLAQSPQETRLRLLLAATDLPCPVAQFEVRDAGGFVARVDLAWPDRRLALEYDGLWHADPVQFRRDRERLNRLTAAGWRVVFVTAADLHRPGQLLRLLRAELA